MKFIYFLIIFFAVSLHANENELAWKGEIQIFEDLTYANNLSADIKRKYKKLVQSEAALSSYSYRHLYLRKMKEKNRGILPQRLEVDLKRNEKRIKSEVAKKIERYQSIINSGGQLSELQKAQHQALLKSGSLEYASLVKRSLIKNPDASEYHPLTIEDWGYLNMYYSGKSEKQVYDQVVENFEKAKLHEPELLRAEERMTYDPKDFRKSALDDLRKRCVLHEGTCDPERANHWNQILERNYAKIQKQTGKDLRDPLSMPPLTMP